MTRRLHATLSLTFGLLAFSEALPQAAEPPYPTVPPRESTEAAATFDALHGFRMRLLAAEPLVTDPVAMAYDEAGRAYVAEMNDYPYTDKAKHKPNQENPTDAALGRIRLLSDTDGDGAYDKATVFAEGLSWPTGVACWKGGVFVIATPDWLYLKDTDGDGKADVREVIWSGFRKYNVQAVANNPQWGLDHRVYLAAGSNGGQLIRTGSRENPVAVARADVSFDPVTNGLRLESGGSRFGQAFDDHGNRFVCNIRNPTQQVLFSPRDFGGAGGGAAFLPPLSPLHDAALSGDALPVHRVSPPEAWRVERAERWARTQEGRMPRSELVGAGVVTSSSGVMIYRGDAYPDEYRGQAFVADVAANLFYRLSLSRAEGLGFRAERVAADGESEFCASEDLWHRPVNFVNDPQGCLTVLDMYREAIEHPWSIPDDIHARLDLRRGADRGRLWRLEPPEFQPRIVPDLGRLGTADLAALLSHPNAWHRETAHRLIFERQDAAAGPLLRELLSKGTSLGRLQALWSLHGLGALTREDLIAAMDKRFPAVQEQAISLAVEFPHDRILQGLILDIDPLNHAAPLVFRALLAAHAMGLREHPSAAPFFSAVAAADVPWLNEALLQAAGGKLDLPLPVRAVDAPGSPLLWLRAHALGRLSDKQEAGRLCHAINGALMAAEHEGKAPAPAALVSLAALQAGLGGANVFDFSETRGVRGLRERALPACALLARSADLPLEVRARLVPLLSRGAPEASLAALSQLVENVAEPELARAALQALATLPGQEPAVAVERLWPGLTPALRTLALEVWFARDERLPALLSAIERKMVSSVHLSRTRRDALLTHSDPLIAETARRVLGNTVAREAVIAHYREALGAPGDAEKGRALYLQWCAVCHRRGEEGAATLGPNLATVQGWTEEQILTNILDPSREVSPEHVEHLAERKDGTTVSGTLAAETEAALVLRQNDGTRVSVPRAELRRLVTAGVSLMPEGFEGALTPEQMGDLLAYLKSSLGK